MHTRRADNQNITRACYSFDVRLSKMSKAVRKIVEESREKGYTEIDLGDKGLSNIADIPGLTQLRNLVRLTLSHNRLTTLPESIGGLESLEYLNVFHNHIEELPMALGNLKKLKYFNAAVNRLSSLPRGLGTASGLEILDLTYNNLQKGSLPGNFSVMKQLRALYLGDNDFETLPDDIGEFRNLQVLVLRDNELIALPKTLGNLTRLRELHLQNNRLTVLPPEMGELDMGNPRHVFKPDGNAWVQQLEDQIVLGPSHVFEYIKTDAYKSVYERHVESAAVPPPKREKEKNAKRSRRK
ncbi:ras suppressor protein 1-like [Acropora millepora]|uniref:ras suppressor protein 1-like n=1 Tax=Acropora millepora TaxID=45264 RepID=UPI001CF13EF0|nr:ras suppressor protein 1-like [Acropora millepora]